MQEKLGILERFTFTAIKKGERLGLPRLNTIEEKLIT